MKLEFLRHEQGTWGCLLEEAQRITMAEAWLAEAQQRVADLSSKMADLRIRQ
jgi:ABC-type Fe3+-hydroxamate transport system substrate-binding protein